MIKNTKLAIEAYVMPSKRNKKADKVPSLSRLTKECDTLYSLYVRKSDMNDDGMVPCFTCDNWFHWKKIHCGHYISRTFKYTRWDLDNLRPQCYACNVIKKGMSHIFRAKLVKEIGTKRVEELEERSLKLFNLPPRAKMAFIQERINAIS